MSQGRIQPLSDDLDSAIIEEWPRTYDMIRTWIPNPRDTDIDDDEDRSLTLRSVERLDSGPVTQLWHRSVSQSVLSQKIKQCGVLSIWLWDVLARLTIACDSMPSSHIDLEEVQQMCMSINDLIKSFRAKFGIFDLASASVFQDLPFDIRRLAGHVLNDTDLAVLVYYDTVQAFQDKLHEQPTSTRKPTLMQILETSKRFCTPQRLISATQIATFACAHQGASPGLQGGQGLKAQIRDLAAHPVSTSTQPGSF